MQNVLNRVPSTDALHRRRGAFAGFLAGVAVPLMLVGLFVVSFRGYGIMEQAPQPPQVYSNF
ncbi:MAG: hypothetical protein HKP37_05950 [Boseongicola sp.]|nr:hypothetical protein [Boseongicola sp.]NNL18267.1 hypothetical protein [Boseongicola sp.]